MPAERSRAIDPPADHRPSAAALCLVLALERTMPHLATTVLHTDPDARLVASKEQAVVVGCGHAASVAAWPDTKCPADNAWFQPD